MVRASAPTGVPTLRRIAPPGWHARFCGVALALVSGCGSSVDLDPLPSDASAAAGTGAGSSAGASGSSAGGSGSSAGGSGTSTASTGSATGPGSGGAGGEEPCAAVPEICNGRDDDCNGSIDDGDPGGGAPCDSGVPGACAAGTTSCAEGALACLPDAVPAPEKCDGIDNDCDAETDEDAGCTRRVFVSSQVFTGDLGGLAGADAKCQSLADAVGLGGIYKAWLSDVTADAATRLSHVGAPYVLVDGVTVVAAGWSQLVGVGPQHAIDMTELGGPPPVGSAQCDPMWPLPTVWTDTQPAGALFQASETCNSWSGGTGPSAWGIATYTGELWTLYCNGGGVPELSCMNTAALYCFEQ
jgi:hypothetical protein